MSNHRTSSRIALWSLQGLLAALFLYAGVSKLILPAAELARLSQLSGEFLQFIGACEFLGALGLVLPGIFRVRRGLTPLAAAGLAIIMAGAVVTTSITHGAAASGFPLVVGVLTAVVAVGRRAWATRAPLAAPTTRAHTTGIPSVAGR